MNVSDEELRQRVRYYIDGAEASRSKGTQISCLNQAENCANLISNSYMRENMLNEVKWARERLGIN